MKANIFHNLKKKNFIGVILILIAILTWGCPAEITVTNCKKQDISIIFSNNLTHHGPPWVVETWVTVSCKGQPVDSANIQVDWPFLTGKHEIQVFTDSLGRYKIRKDNIGSDPTGKSIEVIVKGDDGDKKIIFTIPPKMN